MSIPDAIEFFHSSDEVGLEVHHRELENSYWLFAGQGAIEIREEDLSGLADLLQAFKKERLEYRRSTPVLKWAAGLLLIGMATVVLLLLTQGVVF